MTADLVGLADRLASKGQDLRAVGDNYKQQTIIRQTYDELAGLMEEAATELRALAGAEVGGWRSMENAPMDGTIILIGGGTVGAGDYRSRPFNSVSIAFWYQDHWRGDDMQHHDEWWKHEPTHWQPLPPPPGAGRGGVVNG